MSVLLLLLLLPCCFVHFGKKAMEFWWSVGYSRFLRLTLTRDGRDLFNEGMRDMCTYGSFLSLYQNTENVISLLVLSLPV